MRYLQFIETPIFYKLRQTLMSDDDFRLLQSYLLHNMDTGDLIKQTGECDKIRWYCSSQNKFNGMITRIIYYVKTSSYQIYFIFIHPKTDLSDLSVKQKKMLQSIIKNP